MRPALFLVLLSGCTAIVPVRLRCESTEDCVGFSPSENCFTHTCLQGDCVPVDRALIAPDCRDNDCDGFIDEVAEHPTGTTAQRPPSPVAWGPVERTRLSSGPEGWAAGQSGGVIRVAPLGDPLVSNARELSIVSNDRPDMLTRPDAEGCWSGEMADDSRGADVAFCPPEGVTVASADSWIAYVAGARCPADGLGFDLRVGRIGDDGLELRGEDDASTTFRGVRPTGCDACGDSNTCRPSEPRLAPRGELASLVFLSGPPTAACGDGVTRSVELLELFRSSPGGRAFVTGADGGAPTVLGATRTTGGVGAIRSAAGTYVAYEDEAARLQLAFVPAAPSPTCDQLASCEATVASRAALALGEVRLDEGTHALTLGLVESADSTSAYLIAAWLGDCERPSYAVFVLDVDVPDRPSLRTAGARRAIEGESATHVSVHGLTQGVTTDDRADPTVDEAVRYGGFAIGWVDSDAVASVALLDLEGEPNAAFDAEQSWVAGEVDDVVMLGPETAAVGYLTNGSLEHRALGCAP